MQLCLSMNYAYEFSYLLLAVPWQAVIGLSCFSGYYYSPVLRFYFMFINYCSIYELFMPDLLYLGLQALVVLGSEAPSSQVAPVPWCHARPEVMAGWDKMAALQATIRLSGWWNAPHCLSCYVSVSNGSKKHNGVTAPPFWGVFDSLGHRGDGSGIAAAQPGQAVQALSLGFPTSTFVTVTTVKIVSP